MKKRALLEERRRTIAADTAAYLQRGGQIGQARSAVRRNPLNEDRHNSFLFVSRKR